MPAARALSSPSGAAKEDDILHERILVDCDTRNDGRKHETTDENTDGTLDIGDYVNSIFRFAE